MHRRIERRPYRIGSGNNADPEAIAELEERRDKHERLTRGRPSRAFKAVLRHRMQEDRGDEEESREEHGEGAIEPHLGLAPGQDSALANSDGARSRKVIIKG